MTFYGQKPPLVSPNSFPARRNSSRKIRTETGKIRNLKNEAERWLRFSQMVAPVKKMRDIFFLQPLRKKTSLGFSKFICVCPESFLKKNWSNCKNGGFEFLGRAVLER
jgi:hypothetical protein